MDDDKPRMILLTEKQWNEMQPPPGFGCVIAGFAGLMFWLGFAVGWLVK